MTETLKRSELDTEIAAASPAPDLDKSRLLGLEQLGRCGDTISDLKRAVDASLNKMGTEHGQCLPP